MRKSFKKQRKLLSGKVLPHQWIGISRSHKSPPYASYRVFYQAGWGAIAFWRKSDDGDTSFVSEAITVAELEERVGLSLNFIPEEKKGTLAVSGERIAHVLAAKPSQVEIQNLHIFEGFLND